MFEDLFIQATTIERYRQAPLAEERLRYLQYQEEFGLRTNGLRKLAADQLQIVYLLGLRRDDKVDVSRVEAAARQWSRPGQNRYLRSRSIPASPNSTKCFLRTAVRWLRFLGWLTEPVTPGHAHTTKVAFYEAWMRDERGFSEETIRAYRGAVDEFFGCITTTDTQLSSVKIHDIDRAIAEKSVGGNYSRTTIRMYAQRLRTFFLFAERQGWCRPGMAAAIMPERAYPDQSVPARFSREDIMRLLATTEGDRPIDKRDRAILMIFTSYALRATEVARLQLNDFDWEQETLRVRSSKAGRTHLYPLSPSVGQVVLRYIREVRPVRPERTLFLRLVAPIMPLSRSALWHIVGDRAERLGIVAWRRGPHALRHAAAQHLLDQGMSMKVIGDFLGHRDPSSTSAYAKIDLNALRSVADFDLGDLA